MFPSMSSEFPPWPKAQGDASIAWVLAAVERLGNSALKIAAESAHQRDRMRCASEIIGIATTKIAAGETEAALRELVRAQLELLS
jgi:hypothetical protein